MSRLVTTYQYIHKCLFWSEFDWHFLKIVCALKLPDNCCHISSACTVALRCKSQHQIRKHNRKLLNYLQLFDFSVVFFYLWQFFFLFVAVFFSICGCILWFCGCVFLYVLSVSCLFLLAIVILSSGLVYYLDFTSYTASLYVYTCEIPVWSLLNILSDWLAHSGCIDYRCLRLVPSYLK